MENPLRMVSFHDEMSIGQEQGKTKLEFSLSNENLFVEDYSFVVLMIMEK